MSIGQFKGCLSPSILHGSCINHCNIVQYTSLGSSFWSDDRSTEEVLLSLMLGFWGFGPHVMDEVQKSGAFWCPCFSLCTISWFLDLFLDKQDSILIEMMASVHMPRCLSETGGCNYVQVVCTLVQLCVHKMHLCCCCMCHGCDGLCLHTIWSRHRCSYPDHKSLWKLL